MKTFTFEEYSFLIPSVLKNLEANGNKIIGRAEKENPSNVNTKIVTVTFG